MIVEDLNNLRRTRRTSEITDKDTEVVLMGWVHETRDLGGVKFFLLRDREGTAQILFKKGKTTPELMEKFANLGKEDVVAVKGMIQKNPKAPGGFEVLPSELKILNQAEVLPLDVTGKTPADFDTRLNARVVDLRRRNIGAIFRVRAEILIAARNYFELNGFFEIDTPRIIATATEGGAELFPISYFNREAFLRQSPQIYKELMTACFEQVYEIGPVFRAEPSDTTRHLAEITQMDIEMGFADETDTWKALEGVIHEICKEVKANCSVELQDLGVDIRVPELPFKRISYTDMIKILQKAGLKLEWGDDIPPEAERKITELYTDPVIIYDYPMKMKPYYIHPHLDDPKLSYGFDLIMGGIEISSGGRRIHDPELYIKMIKEKGMNPDNFESVIKFFRWGMPPHAGWSVGIDRLTMILCGLKNVKEAVLFPRDVKRLTP